MIRPVSFVQNQPKFGNKKLENNNCSKFNTPSQINYKNGFMAGIIYGGLLSLVGTSIYKDSQIDKQLKEIAAEIVYDTDSLKIEDRNQDEIPDIVVVDRSGNETIYDLTSGQTYIDEDGELIERH